MKRFYFLTFFILLMMSVAFGISRPDIQKSVEQKPRDNSSDNPMNLIDGQYYKLNDSIELVKQKESIFDLKKKYETEKTEKNQVILEKRQLLFISLLIFISSILIFFAVFQRSRNLRTIDQRDKKLGQDYNSYLQDLIKTKNNELTKSALRLIEMQKNNDYILEKISGLLNTSVEKESILERKITHVLKMRKTNPNLVKEFEQRIKDTNEEFFIYMLQKYPSLTPTELKIAALLRTKLTTKEIAQITNRSIRTIDFTRNSIRKKLNLEAQDSLSIYLMTIS